MVATKFSKADLNHKKYSQQSFRKSFLARILFFLLEGGGLPGGDF